MMIETFLALVLFAAGWWLGRRTGKTTPPTVEQQEQDRAREDRAAFSQLMGYNQSQAYGLHDE